MNRSVNVKGGIDMTYITSKLAVLTVPQDTNSESLASFLDTRQCRLYNMTGQSYPRTIGRSVVSYSIFIYFLSIKYYKCCFYLKT